MTTPCPCGATWQAGTSLLPLADVVVSTDVTNGGQESDEQNWGLNGELNTGTLPLTPNP